MTSLITINGNVIEDEGLGIVTLASDNNTGVTAGAGNNVTLSTFQTDISTLSPQGLQDSNATDSR